MVLRDTVLSPEHQLHCFPVIRSKPPSITFLGYLVHFHWFSCLCGSRHKNDSVLLSEEMWAGLKAALHLAGGAVVRAQESCVPSDLRYSLPRFSTRKPLRVKALSSTLTISHNNRSQHSVSVQQLQNVRTPEQKTVPGTPIPDHRGMWPLAQAPGQCCFLAG